MNSTDDPRKTANLFRDNGEKKHSKHASWHVRIRTEWNPFRLARKAERRGYEKGHAEGHAEGLREGYAPRVLDQADQKAQLTDSGSYFTGEIRADAEGDYLGDVIITLGADSYRLRSETAETLAAEIDWAVANGHYTGEDIDAAMKARIEEDGWS